jgi:glycosyltransferase involved in cell wall biosynthesis
MRINLILPSFPQGPGGGMKVMFEYANRLSSRGFDVTIYYSLNTPYFHYRKPYILRLLVHKILYPGAKPKWFALNKNIKNRIIRKVDDQYIDNADFTMSTWWSIAYETAKLRHSAGQKINLIQGFEVWKGHNDLVIESYKLPMTHIVINDYLKDLVVTASGHEPFLIYNAIDEREFFVKAPIEERNNATVCMIYSEQPHKGSKDGIEALMLCKEKCPDLTADLFGVYQSPQNLPEWIRYHRMPDNLVDIYNRNAVYLAPNIQEGWDLPATEAMFCGCALVCTDIPGHGAFLRDGECNLAVKVKDAKDMSEKLLTLLLNPQKRVELAKKGHQFSQRFSWDKSINAMLNILNGLKN